MNHLQNKRIIAVGWYQKRWDFIWFWWYLWDFILLTVESWAARLALATYLINNLWRERKNILSEESSAWMGPWRREYIWLFVGGSQGSTLVKADVLQKVWVDEVGPIMDVYALCTCSAEEFGLDLMAYSWIGVKEILDNQYDLKNKKTKNMIRMYYGYLCFLQGCFNKFASNFRLCWKFKTEVWRKCRHWLIEFGKLPGGSQRKFQNSNT